MRVTLLIRTCHLRRKGPGTDSCTDICRNQPATRIVEIIGIMDLGKCQCNHTTLLQKVPKHQTDTSITTRHQDNHQMTSLTVINNHLHHPVNNQMGQTILKEADPGQPSPNEQQSLDPTLTMVHNLLSQVLHQGASNGTPPPPDFLKYVMMMKTLGTYRFEGNHDPDEADAWMQCLDKNFAVTRCPTKFKKDVAVYYLEKEALGWWNSVDRQTNHTIITWEAFQREIRRKYFPLEARDRMEQAFVTLTQGNKSVREYEAEFIRLQKYVIYGNGDDGVMVRKFLQGLSPETGGRLQAVTYTHLYDLIEKAVNVESFIKREKAIANRNKDNPNRGESSNSKNITTAKKTYPSNQGERPRMENMSRGDGACFVCGSKGHFARSCPEKRENGMAVTTQYQPTCYYCGVKGHFSNNCPVKTSKTHRPADRQPAMTRSANEAPNKRRAPAECVYAMGAEIGENRDQSGGPITGLHTY
ncbi:unnamed protein product [Microthlaspi erraticum]|uniref:CCHC-type domain-containing protein n=1 Tax=Microthlaspi erraticum TaxID=1685480 RepID=A0A6D2JWD6_9BRAS|nr:unnamed protein product [Microthlaspi erraticum]